MPTLLEFISRREFLKLVAATGSFLSGAIILPEQPRPARLEATGQSTAENVDCTCDVSAEWYCVASVFVADADRRVYLV